MTAARTCTASFVSQIRKPTDGTVARVVGPTDSWCGIVNAAKPGDEIAFTPGVYTGTCYITAKGHSSGPIVMRSREDASGNRATFQYTGTTTNVLELHDAAYVSIKGFRFAGTQPGVDAIRILSGSDITIDGNAFDSIGGTSIRASNLSVARLSILRNTFTRLTHAAMKLGCPDGTTCKASDVLVEDNAIDGITPTSSGDAAYGVELRRNSYGTIRGNSVAHTAGPGIVVQGAGVVRTVIEKNTVEAAMMGGIVVSGNHVTIRNNVIVGCAAGGILFQNGSQVDDWVVNNTLVGNGGVGIDVSTWSTAASSGNVLAFNAIQPASGAVAVRPANPIGTVRGNITCGTSPACFDNQLAPLPSGPLAGAAGGGTEPWRPTDDYADTPRTAPADVGAIERTR
jgi:hypothetical protein